jgi:hypothetical protein
LIKKAKKGLHKGRPSYRRSLQSSKENLQHCKRLNLSIVFILALSDPDPETPLNSDTDPDPQLYPGSGWTKKQRSGFLIAKKMKDMKK